MLARGTGRENRITQRSVNAIEQWTGISRPNAVKAVKDLLERGICKKTREGKHPIYEFFPGDQIPGGPFTAAEQAAISAIREGRDVPYGSNSAVEALKARLIVKERTDRTSRSRRHKSLELDEAAISKLTAPLNVWLPNALIDGVADETPPIELIRQTRSVSALRLLVEFYAVQFLPNYGGMPRELLKVEFERARIGQQGPFVVWGFRLKNFSTAAWSLARPFLTGEIKKRDNGERYDAGWDDFWDGQRTLVDLGLLERVGMLLDGDDAEAEIIHPYAMRAGEGDTAERQLALTAALAAASMVTNGQGNWAEQNGYHWLAPVRRHIVKATMVEVFRLRYRPHTAATAAWYALMRKTTAEHLTRYQALTQRPEKTASIA
jgi:hypothetical protein